MKDIKKQINKIYDDFKKREFIAENYPNLHRRIAYLSTKSPHPIGNPVILYTPEKFKPEYVIISNNPSWFDKDAIKSNSAAKRAFRIVQEMGYIPKINSHICHPHNFGIQLTRIFNDIGKLDVLKNCVALNRFWVQTGPSDELKNEDTEYEYKRLVNYCEKGTRSIVDIISPKVVFLIGEKARRTFDGYLDNYVNLKKTQFVSLRHPSHGGSSQCMEQLASFFSFKNTPGSLQCG